VTAGEGFDLTAEYLIDVAATLDMIYVGADLRVPGSDMRTTTGADT
jgi:hypothetical protein